MITRDGKRRGPMTSIRRVTSARIPADASYMRQPATRLQDSAPYWLIAMRASGSGEDRGAGSAANAKRLRAIKPHPSDDHLPSGLTRIMTGTRVACAAARGVAARNTAHLPHTEE
jgi:hypothetical protein